MAARQSGSALVISSTSAKSLSRMGNWPSRAGSRVRALTTLAWVSETTTSVDSPVPVLTRNARSLPVRGRAGQHLVLGRLLQPVVGEPDR